MAVCNLSADNSGGKDKEVNTNIGVSDKESTLSSVQKSNSVATKSLTSLAVNVNTVPMPGSDRIGECYGDGGQPVNNPGCSYSLPTPVVESAIAIGQEKVDAYLHSMVGQQQMAHNADHFTFDDK